MCTAMASGAKSRDPDNRRSYIYRLTEKGSDLAPIIVEMMRWSATYDPRTFVPKKVVNRILRDREGFLAELRAQASKK